MSKLTYKVKHTNNLTCELVKAKQVAEFALVTKSLTSKDVKHIGLKSVISNQILKKYSKNKKIKRIKSVKLIVPNQGIKFTNNIIKITSLKLDIPFNKNVIKICQV